jgi:hypothetical protein
VMGGKTTETCWAVNKRQDNKLKNCCIRLVIYLNCRLPCWLCVSEWVCVCVCVWVCVRTRGCASFLFFNHLMNNYKTWNKLRVIWGRANTVSVNRLYEC